ncbi:nucleotidyltransferase family protein [Pseudanabaena sp. FACHB-2040]|uniref:nucleotidyltransferase family protein n=1 Tax=Pseudanabaena sp. FACHB-2040 TaxID=2692859 RepID=UPI0016850082|nr:nucleotidyltransferase family protein [Pseudanabaena sp. FACHB-2040]MBD2261171.1 nucleotidyltransferase family protein [Pseudanabaena sp. FACHB-2040]
MSRIGILILAAGASSRLGQPKQLLSYQGKPLIRQMAEVAISSGCHPIGIVLGAYGETIQPYLADLGIHIIYNKQWQTGMAGSLQCGLREILMLSPDLDAIVLMVCDQPFVSPRLIHQLISSYQALNYPIVASKYAGILGVPALLHRSFFPDLFALQGDMGARVIIQQHRSRSLSIPFAEGAIDLDTPQSLEILEP